MIEKFCPNEWAGSVQKVDLNRLRQSGLEGIILDLDNTIVPWNDATVTEEILDWIARAKSLGFRICIASNGLEERVSTISEHLDIPAISKAIKPRKKPFRRALELLGTTPNKTVVIGDQIFTDILGGNRMDFYTILITPLSNRELKTTQLVRKMERSVIKRLARKGMASTEELALRRKPE